MDLDQIIKLIDAGYSKEEIAAMAKLAGNEPKQPSEPKEPSEPKQPAEPKQPEEPKNNSIDATIAKLDSLSSKLDKYAESIAKLAIMNTQQPPKQDMNDFLASIINPHYNEEDK